MAVQMPCQYYSTILFATYLVCTLVLFFARSVTFSDYFLPIHVCKPHAAVREPTSQPEIIKKVAMGNDDEDNVVPDKPERPSLAFCGRNNCGELFRAICYYYYYILASHQQRLIRRLIFVECQKLLPAFNRSRPRVIPKEIEEEGFFG